MNQDKPTTSPLDTNASVWDYAGEDLTVLAELNRYRAWIIDSIRPHVGGQVAEIGAGIGTYTHDMLQLPAIDKLFVVEPSPPLFATLEQRFSGNSRVCISAAPGEQWTAQAEPESLDCVVMINVLEHIEDDLGTLHAIRRILRPGGRLIIFVPALMGLFSELDRLHGHHRRYHRPQLTQRADQAGLELLECRYFDILGTLPWLVMNRWLGKTSFNARLISLYDTVGVPVTRFCERLVSPPFGKNLLMVAQRPLS